MKKVAKGLKRRNTKPNKKELSSKIYKKDGMKVQSGKNGRVKERGASNLFRKEGGQTNRTRD